MVEWHTNPAPVSLVNGKVNATLITVRESSAEREASKTAKQPLPCPSRDPSSQTLPYYCVRRQALCETETDLRETGLSELRAEAVARK